MRTLTADEARRRSRLLQVHSYDVRLDLRDDAGFTSVTEVRFAVTDPGSETFLELDGEVVEVVRSGRPVELQVHGNRLLLDRLSAEEVVRVTARCAWSRTGEGLQRSVDPADGAVYVYSQAFLDDAQRMLACFDQPDLKAVLRLTVVAPASWTVLSTTRAATTQQGEVATHVFAPTPPLPTYLFCLAAGPWHGQRRQHDGVELSTWCRQSAVAHFDADEVLDLTALALDFQSELFGRRYPFGDSYAQVFAPDFVAGAMENPGMVTFSEERFVFRGHATEADRRGRGVVIAHELCHMWFGDLVTMRWWDDLWLSEAFAELVGYLTCDRALPYAGAWDDFGLGRKAWGYRADSLPTTHPVADDVPDTRAALLNFDGISYAKGASVLRQLMAWLGEEEFFAGVRDYLDRHAWGSTALPDLLECLERASGRDLREWAQLWLRTSGTSTLRVTEGAVVQTGQVLRPHRVGVAAYDDVAGRLVRRERRVVDVVGGRTPVPGLAPAALVLPNSGDLTFATVRFDESSLQSLRRGLSTVADPLDRAVAWGGLWDSCRSAELPPGELVEIVVAHLHAESDPALVATLLGQATVAAALWSTSAHVLHDLHAAVTLALAVAPGGSDRQLLLARTAADTATEPALLEGWLSGESRPAGLVLDADLRWHLLAALAALGAVDADRIGQEHAADATAAGDRGAARATASLPDAASKAAVWSELVGDPDLSTDRARALGRGFWQPRQDLGPYVERYFADVPAVFGQRSPTVATTLAGLLYPRTVVTADVVDRTDALLAGELPTALRRTVLEVRDDLVRALAARAV